MLTAADGLRRRRTISERGATCPSSSAGWCLNDAYRGSHQGGTSEQLWTRVVRLLSAHCMYRGQRCSQDRCTDRIAVWRGGREAGSVVALVPPALTDESRGLWLGARLVIQI